MDSQRSEIATDIHNFVSATSSSTLSGQVFIVTKGADNIKLGGVHVFLYPQSQMDFILEPKKQEAATQLTIISTQLKDAKQKYSEADAANANGGYIVQNGVYTDARKRMAELQNQIEQLNQAGEVFLSPDYYFSDLPTPLADVKTDSDGNFTLTVPTGRYVLVAKASRSILDQDELYYWMVRFDMGNIARSVQLSNENLSSSGSDDSLISTE